MNNLTKREQLKASQEIEKLQNPAKKFYKWESESKKFSFYQKGETKEQGKKVLVDLPFNFVTLGKPLFCVKGFNDKLNLGFYSNEVRTFKDELIVRYFDKNQPIIAKGAWADVKDKVDNVDGKYHLSIYGYDLEKKEIINIDVKGNGIGEWIEFFKRYSGRLADEIVTINNYKEGKKGSVKFTYPTFNLERTISDDELDEVIDALETLKKYHNEYFKKSVSLVDFLDDTKKDDLIISEETENLEVENLPF